jgi:hypothetical protein
MGIAQTRMKTLLIATMFFLPLTAANALQLFCQLPSAKDGTLLETLRITIAAGHSVNVWHKWEGTSYWREHEEIEKVLFHSLTTSNGNADGSLFSVLVIEQRWTDKALGTDAVFPPNVYFIDWGKAKLALVNVPVTRAPTAQVDVRWECERVD